MVLEFSGEAIEWRGPAPFIFVAAPQEEGQIIKEMASQLTYGWGCIPVVVTIGKTQYKTSLFPKNGTYLVPIKVAVQKSESVHLGDIVQIALRMTLRSA